MAQQFIYWIDYKVTQYRLLVNELRDDGGGRGGGTYRTPTHRKLGHRLNLVFFFLSLHNWRFSFPHLSDERRQLWNEQGAPDTRVSGAPRSLPACPRLPVKREKITPAMQAILKLQGIGRDQLHGLARPSDVSVTQVNYAARLSSRDQLCVTS